VRPRCERPHGEALNLDEITKQHFDAASSWHRHGKSEAREVESVNRQIVRTGRPMRIMPEACFGLTKLEQTKFQAHVGFGTICPHNFCQSIQHTITNCSTNSD
jgi:hypothetical protein